MALNDLLVHPPSLYQMVEGLQHPVFTIGDATIPLSQVLDVLLSAVSVGLVMRRHALNWPIGIVNVMMYWAILMNNAPYLDSQHVEGKYASGLYVDASLQGAYLVSQAWAWWAWLYGGRDGSGQALRRTSSAEWVVFAVVGAAGIGLLTWVLSAWTTWTAPFAGASAAVISLVAIYGWGRKLLESWWLWIAADLIYMALNTYDGLRLGSFFNNAFVAGGIDVILLALHVVGLVIWRRAWASQRVTAAQPVAAPWPTGMR